MKKTGFSNNRVRQVGFGSCGRLLLATFYLLLSSAAVASTVSADQPAGYRVSADGRYLLAPDGQPFFWLGDTAWTLCDVLNREDAAHYLDVRAKQGFTVIQLPAVMSRYVGRPNAYGDKPLVGDDLARPSVTPGNSPDNASQYSKKPWKDALTDPGAVYVSIAARLLKSLPWWRLAPDQSVIARSVGTGAGLNVAARSDDGSCAVIYLSEAGSVSIRMTRLATGPVRAVWMDPKTGERTPAGEHPNTGEQSFSPPAAWEDAVLLLETKDRSQPHGS